MRTKRIIKYSAKAATVIPDKREKTSDESHRRLQKKDKEIESLKQHGLQLESIQGKLEEELSDVKAQLTNIQQGRSDKVFKIVILP